MKKFDSKTKSKNSLKRKNLKKNKGIQNSKKKGGEQRLPPLLLVSHGQTPTTQNIEIQGQSVDFEQSFVCPDHISINLFETMGQLFPKSDAGLLTNLISQLNLYDTIASSDNNIDKFLTAISRHKFRMPLANKDYYARRYLPGEKVPNILFTLQDNQTQLGLFYFQEKGQTGENYKPLIVDFNQACNAQWDINFDADINESILGPKKMGPNTCNEGKPIWVYENPYQNLKSICENINSDLKEHNRYVNLNVISCRGFTNQKINNAVKQVNQIVQHQQTAEKEYNQYFNGLHVLINECVQRSGTSINPQVVKKAEELKSKLDSDLNKLVNDLKNVVNDIKYGYDDFQKTTIEIALQDHLDQRPFFPPVSPSHPNGLPTDLNLYIPKSPGNIPIRILHNLEQTNNNGDDDL